MKRSLSLLALAAASLPIVACGGGGADTSAQNPQTAQQPQPYPPPQGYPQQYPPPQQGYPQQPPPTAQQQPFPQQPAPQQPQAFPQQPQPAPQPGAPGPAPSASAPASPLPGIPIDPNLLGQLMGGAGTTPAPAGGGGLTDFAGAAVKIAQVRFAPSPMQPEGNMSEDSLQAGQRKDIVMTLQGGKCYTIIGASPIGQITNLNITLLAPPFYNVNAGTDNMTGNTAVIGSGNNPLCPITPFPLQYKLAVSAVSGQGTFAVQLYSKPK